MVILSLFQMHIAAEFHLKMMFFNEKVSTWEPLIEPVMEKEGVYRPWEVLVKVRGKKKNNSDVRYRY